MAIEVKIKKNLGGFQLEVEFASQSRRIGILGASGCGKSMTLKSIAGIEVPDQGKIDVDGRILYGEKIFVKPQKRKVGYLFQNYALFPTMTVGANIAAGLSGARQEKENRVDQMIGKFHLEGLKDRLPGELSGGQQQRVALARIMAYEPDVILLDEPFSALDGFLKDRLQQEMMEMLEDYPGTVIMVSHSRDEIYRFSEELIIMDGGRTVCQGKTKEVFDDPQYKDAARLTGCKNIVAVERKNAHELVIPAWQTELRVQREIPENISHIGVRAHDFIPIWGEDPGDSVAMSAYSVADLPFEKKYFIEFEEKEIEPLCWFVQRERLHEIEQKGMPQFLQIPEEKLLLLQE